MIYCCNIFSRQTQYGIKKQFAYVIIRSADLEKKITCIIVRINYCKLNVDSAFLMRSSTFQKVRTY